MRRSEPSESRLTGSPPSEASGRCHRVHHTDGSVTLVLRACFSSHHEEDNPGDSVTGAGGPSGPAAGRCWRVPLLRTPWLRHLRRTARSGGTRPRGGGAACVRASGLLPSSVLWGGVLPWLSIRILARRLGRLAS